MEKKFFIAMTILIFILSFNIKNACASDVWIYKTTADPELGSYYNWYVVTESALIYDNGSYGCDVKRVEYSSNGQPSEYSKPVIFQYGFNSHLGKLVCYVYHKGDLIKSYFNPFDPSDKDYPLLKAISEAAQKYRRYQWQRNG